MLHIDCDDIVDRLNPIESVSDLTCLLSLLVGAPIEQLLEESFAFRVLTEFLEKVRESSEKQDEYSIEYAQFNELLLLLNQNRIQLPFFGFFFKYSDSYCGEEQLRAIQPNSSMRFSDIIKGVSKFRAYAMLCFGSFRFAFNRLTIVTKPKEFLDLLYGWHNTEALLQSFVERCQPVSPIQGSDDYIPLKGTWFIGYLTRRMLDRDATALEIYEEGLRSWRVELERDGDPIPDDLARREDQSLVLRDRLTKWKQEKDHHLSSAENNSHRYLTWDYLDVYVATSMREQWEFEETHGFIRKVLGEFQRIPKQNVRVFDPTQSNFEYPSDKGLLEALMLKRAACTLYMAQEVDTFGKDSELAATLAQGKPVIAYVPKVDGRNIVQYKNRLSERPIRYYSQRLHALIASDFLNKEANLNDIIARMKQYHNIVLSNGGIRIVVFEFLKFIDLFLAEDLTFLLLDQERETDFRAEHVKDFRTGLDLLSVIESVAADSRAALLQKYHPLSMQVHLASGVANGLIVVRSAPECARVLEQLLLQDIHVHIVTEAGKDNEGSIINYATILKEVETGSRFRMVTENQALANSFWNFYNME